MEKRLCWPDLPEGTKRCTFSCIDDSPGETAKEKIANFAAAMAELAEGLDDQPWQGNGCILASLHQEFERIEKERFLNGTSP